MRISDWSSDVCSSDLLCRGRALPLCAGHRRPVRNHRGGVLLVAEMDRADVQPVLEQGAFLVERGVRQPAVLPAALPRPGRHAAAHSGLQRRVCRSEEHTSELQSLMRTSYAVFCLKKKKII